MYIVRIEVLKFTLFQASCLGGKCEICYDKRRDHELYITNYMCKHFHTHMHTYTKLFNYPFCIIFSISTILYTENPLLHILKGLTKYTNPLLLYKGRLMWTQYSTWIHPFLTCGQT